MTRTKLFAVGFVLLALMVGMSASQVSLVPASADEVTLAGAFGVPVITVKGTTYIASQVPLITFSNEAGGTVNGWSLGSTFTVPVSYDSENRLSYKVTQETAFMAVNLRVFNIDANRRKGTRIEVEDQDGIRVSSESDCIWVNLPKAGPGRYLLVSQVRHDQSRRDYRFFFVVSVVEHVMRTDEAAIAFNVVNVNEDVQSFMTGLCGVSKESDLTDSQVQLLRSRIYSMGTIASSIMLAYKPAEYSEALGIASQQAAGIGPALAPRTTDNDPEVLRARAEAAAWKSEAGTWKETADKEREAREKLQQQPQSTPPPPPPLVSATPVAAPIPEAPVTVQPTQAERLRRLHPNAAIVVALDEGSSEDNVTLFFWVQQADGRWIQPDKGFVLTQGEKGESWFTYKAVADGHYIAIALSRTPDAREWVFPLDGRARVQIMKGGEPHEG